jgi:RNA polymerase sigma-70 factor (ECF subfamily)
MLNYIFTVIYQGGINLLAFIMTIDNEKDRELATELYKQYSSTMLYIADNILHDIHLAEDAVSEAFIKIINNLDKININDCYRTRGFVVIIVRNTALDILRKHRRRKETMVDYYDDSIPYEEPDFENITVEEAYQKVIRCIGRLNKNYSDILYLKMEFDYSYNEIGYLLGITQGNVKTRLSRARKALKIELDKED